MSDEGQKFTVHVGDSYEVTALRLNDDGDGVATISGLTVFVPGLLPQETAIIKLTSVHRRFARGQVVERLNDALERVEPVCPVFEACGGCQLQHVSYPSQLAQKQQTVAWALNRLSQQNAPEILPTIGMGEPYRYRNQVQVPVKWDGADGTGVLRAGFFATGSHEMVETTTCYLESTQMETTIRYVIGWLESLGGQVARIVHHVILRESLTTSEQMLILSIRSGNRTLQYRLSELLDHAPIVSVGLTIQAQSDGPVWGPRVDIVAGKSHLTERILGLEYLISPRSFFQVNTAQAERLYEQAVMFADLTGSENVLDAYCGTGSMSLLFARQAASVVGIETIPAAIADAKANSEHNRIANVEFVVGEVEIQLPRLLAAGRTFDVIVLDPPRKGVHRDVLTAVLAAKPKRIVYVSCNPATLGRDVAAIVAGGYEATIAQPVDMFPQTSHVECVILMSRVEK